MINKNSNNSELKGKDKAQTDGNNQNVIYDQTEISEAAICGEKYASLF